MRPEEPRSFEEAKAIDLADAEAVRFWLERLNVTEEELAEAVEKVGSNRTAVEIFLGQPGP
jgi:hypothetical protein